MAALLGRELEVEIFVSPYDARELEAIDDSLPRSHAKAAAVVVVQRKNLADRTRECLGILWRGDATSIGDDPGDIADVRHCARNPACHRFADRVWERFL